MRVGDADATVWRVGLRHSYACSVSSRGGPNVPLKKYRYLWSAEQWTGDEEPEQVDYVHGKSVTFAAALRAAFRGADWLERREQAKRAGARRKASRRSST